jgi:hypothetical protein
VLAGALGALYNELPSAASSKSSPGKLAERGGKTRLTSRSRFRLPTLAARIGVLLMEPGSLLMQRRMFHGIKQRAERLASDHSD